MGRLGVRQVERGLKKLQKLQKLQKLSQDNKITGRRRGKNDIRRSYYATIQMVCCRDGLTAYSPAIIEVSGEVTTRKFNESLNTWKREVYNRLDKKYRHHAEAECDEVGSRALCHFEINLLVNQRYV